MTRYQTVRIYPSPAQKKLIDIQLECHRVLYNQVLEQANKAYENSKIFISSYNLSTKWVKHYREIDIRFKNCNYSSLQHTVGRFDKARKALIQKRKSKNKCQLRFKKPYQFCSIEYTYGDGIKIAKDKIRIQGIGTVKAFGSKEITNPKWAILTKRANTYYVNFSQNYENGTTPQEGSAIGIDFGIKKFLTLSNGEVIHSPKFLKRDLKEVKRAHRRIHKEEKGSKKREKAKVVLTKIHKRITNRRKNFNHHVSRRLVNQYSLICLENLDSTKLEKNGAHALNRTILDLGFGQFKQFLSYKAESAGKKVVFVNPAYTSQKCSACGNMVPKTLDERIHRCGCGYEDDRDVNAAKNILNLALGLQCLAGDLAPLLRSSGIYCGE